MVIGVALGIGIADALVVLIGTGPVQIAVACGAMVVATAFGGSTVLVGEAAASALLSYDPAAGDRPVGRAFFDSLLGGIVHRRHVAAARNP